MEIVNHAAHSAQLASRSVNQHQALQAIVELSNKQASSASCQRAPRAIDKLRVTLTRFVSQESRPRAVYGSGSGRRAVQGSSISFASRGQARRAVDELSELEELTTSSVSLHVLRGPSTAL